MATSETLNDDSTEIARNEEEDSLEDLEIRPKLTGAELDREDFEEFEAAGGDIPDDPALLTEIEVKIVPPQADEFICESCYLVSHRSQKLVQDGKQICRDCE